MCSPVTFWRPMAAMSRNFLCDKGRESGEEGLKEGKGNRKEKWNQFEMSGWHSGMPLPGYSKG